MKTEEFKTELRRLVEKDTNSLKRIYVEYFPKIYGISLAMTKDKQVAYDLSMEVILKLINYKGDIDQIKNPIGLLVTMTKNTVKDYWHRAKRFISCIEPVPTVSADETEKTLLLSDILAQLSEEERHIFVAHIVLDKTFVKIAKELKISLITVKRRYKKIKNKISIFINKE